MARRVKRRRRVMYEYEGGTRRRSTSYGARSRRFGVMAAADKYLFRWTWRFKRDRRAGWL